jgi:rhamnosyltransferase
LLGRRGFFTDANGCVAKQAWEQVPFGAVAYAEDHVLAHEMLRAGFAKVFVPDAAVIHSHDYSGWDWLRRSFDEARAVAEVYDHRDPGRVRPATLWVWGQVGADLRWARTQSPELASGLLRTAALAASSLRLRLLQVAGSILGTRAERLPEAALRRLSLEGRIR